MFRATRRTTKKVQFSKKVLLSKKVRALAPERPSRLGLRHPDLVQIRVNDPVLIEKDPTAKRLVKNLLLVNVDSREPPTGRQQVSANLPGVDEPSGPP